MVKNYKPLKNIEEKVEHLMNELGVQSVYSVREAVARRQNFYITDTVYKDKRIIFKVRIADHRVIKQWGKSFQNERRFLRTLQKNDPYNKIIDTMPVYLESHLNGVEWLICDFVDTKPVGATNISFDAEPTKASLDKIIKLLLDIQQFPIQGFCDKHRWTTKNLRWNDYEKSHDFFKKLLKRCRKPIYSVLTKEMTDQAEEILRDNADLIDGACTLFCHGDFHPGNIIVLDDKAIALDWETLHVDNAAYDIANLWVRMLDHPKERRYLLTEFAKLTQQKEFFQDLFRLNLLIRLADESTIWVKLYNEAEPGTLLSEKMKRNVDLCYSNYISALNNDPLEKYE